MRNESKYDRRGAEPWHIVPVRIFLKDLSEINSDTTRKMMILTRRGWSLVKIRWRSDGRS